MLKFNFFEDLNLKKIMNIILLSFIFYVISSVAFGGYALKWSWVNEWAPAHFNACYDETASRPFIYRRFLFYSAKKIESLIPEQRKAKLIRSLQKRNFTQYFSQVHIDPNYYIAYHLVYFLSFACFFACLFVLRRIGFEITGSKDIGTVSACCFGLLFPLTDSRYFYDFSEVLFFSLATLFALKGWWKALLILSPIAEYNKESFLFFLMTLFPILVTKIGMKKAGIVSVVSILFSGCVYLYERSIFSANSGSTTFYQLPAHLEHIFNYHSWFDTGIQYGMIFGYGTFLPYLLLLAWIIKCTWKKLLPAFRYHIEIALALNIPLYLLFCALNEIRNFSLLYMGFMIMLAIYIKDLITNKGEDDFGAKN